MIKKIVVFGGSGFLGKYFCEEILHSKSNIKLFNYDINKIDFKSKYYHFVKGDIQDKKKLKTFLKTQILFLILQECQILKNVKIIL